MKHDHRSSCCNVIVSACAAMLWITACEPTFNWRKVDFDVAGLELMLPCKPDRATRVLPVGPITAEFHMLGCVAGGATFAVTSTRLAPSMDTTEMIKLWRLASEKQWRVPGVVEAPFSLVGADAIPAGTVVGGLGSKADGAALHVQALYFARDRQIYQATMLSDHANPQVAEAFFSGLRLP